MSLAEGESPRAQFDALEGYFHANGRDVKPSTAVSFSCYCPDWKLIRRLAMFVVFSLRHGGDDIWQSIYC